MVLGLLGLLWPLVAVLVVGAILYEIVRSAVRRGTREALRDHEMWKRGQS